MMQSAAEGVLLVAHGTVTDLDELAPFLTSIRRGRPPSDELIAEMRRRYTAIDRSPHLDTTSLQANLLARRIGRRVLTGMRFGSPSIEQSLRESAALGLEHLVVLPMAPYSVDLYAGEVRARYEAMRGLAPTARIRLSAVVPWGTKPSLVHAHASLIRTFAGDALDDGASLVLSAHSLPMRVIESGDSYAVEAAACASLIGDALGVESRLCFQSQGADGGRWLGPDIVDVVTELAESGQKHIVLAPFGFLCDHVETLFDLDIELKSVADRLGVRLRRVPALGVHAGLIDTLVELVIPVLSSAREAQFA